MDIFFAGLRKKICKSRQKRRKGLLVGPKGGLISGLFFVFTFPPPQTFPDLNTSNTNLPLKPIPDPSPERKHRYATSGSHSPNPDSLCTHVESGGRGRRL